VHDVVVDVLGADVLDQEPLGALILDVARPGHVESPGILDREVDAQHLALVAAVDDIIDPAGTAEAARTNWLRLRARLVYHVEAVDDVERLGMGRAVSVNRRKRLHGDTDGIHDERVALVAPNGIAIPAGRHFRGVLRVQAHVAYLARMREEQRYLTLLLENLK